MWLGNFRADDFCWRGNANFLSAFWAIGRATNVVVVSVADLKLKIFTAGAIQDDLRWEYLVHNSKIVGRLPL